MPVSEKAGGSQTAVVGTEHTLTTITDAGTYQLLVSLRNMVGGTTPDELELRIKVKIRTGEVLEEIIPPGVYVGAQGNNLIAVSPPVPGVVEWVATLKQTAGAAGRAFVWSVVEY